MLLNKANIHLSGSSMACRVVLAGVPFSLSPPPFLLFPLLCLPFFSVVFSSSSWRLFAGLGCT